MFFYSESRLRRDPAGHIALCNLDGNSRCLQATITAATDSGLRRLQEQAIALLSTTI